MCFNVELLCMVYVLFVILLRISIYLIQVATKLVIKWERALLNWQTPNRNHKRQFIEVSVTFVCKQIVKLIFVHTFGRIYIVIYLFYIYILRFNKIQFYLYTNSSINQMLLFFNVSINLGSRSNGIYKYVNLSLFDFIFVCRKTSSFWSYRKY